MMALQYYYILPTYECIRRLQV